MSTTNQAAGPSPTTSRGLPIVLQARNFLSLIHDLIRVLTQENELLQNPDTASLGPLVREKEALMRLYEQETDSLAAAKPFMDKLPPELADQLRQAALEFDRLIKINQRELQIGLTVSEKIMDSIKEAAYKVKTTVQLYGRNGALNQSSRPAPVAINRQV